jgi:hypothetical protein
MQLSDRLRKAATDAAKSLDPAKYDEIDIAAAALDAAKRTVIDSITDPDDSAWSGQVDQPPKRPLAGSKMPTFTWELTWTDGWNAGRKDMKAVCKIIFDVFLARVWNTAYKAACDSRA